MKGSDGQRADSHGGLIAQQHGAYPFPGLHTDTLDTPTYSVPYAPTVRVPCPDHVRIAHPQIEGGGRTLAGRLEREMRGLTRMAWEHWDDKYARQSCHRHRLLGGAWHEGISYERVDLVEGQRADSHVPWLTNFATTWRLSTPRYFPGGAWHGPWRVPATPSRGSHYYPHSARQLRRRTLHTPLLPDSNSIRYPPN